MSTLLSLPILTLVPVRSRPGRYTVSCPDVSSASLGFAQAVDGGWKTWAGSRVFGSLIELLDHVARSHGLTEYRIDTRAVADTLLEVLA